MRLLIDGDIIAYRAGFASEKTKYLVNDGPEIFFYDDAKATKAHGPQASVWTRKEVQPEDQALLIADVMVKDIREHYAAENPSVSVFLTGVGNFRNSVATRASYKGNRSGSVPPVHLKAIRNHLIERGAIVSAGEEADDLIGIAATVDPGSVVASIDKDLLQLPGRHYDFVKKEETTISQKEAVLNFYSQVISGDSTDNVPGVTGLGPVRAGKALAGAKSALDCWKIALALYVKEFGDVLGPVYALEAARLVYVRRTVGELWTPPDATQTTEALPVKKASRSRRVPVSA